MIPPSNSSAEQHQSFRTTFLILCIIVVFVLFFGRVLHTSQQVQLPVVDQARVAENQQKLEECLRDKTTCVGSFVKEANGGLFRVGNCDQNCGTWEVSFRAIEVRISAKNPWYAQRIAYVAFPTEPIWKEAAVKHAEQFVMKRRGG